MHAKLLYCLCFLIPTAVVAGGGGGGVPTSPASTLTQSKQESHSIEPKFTSTEASECIPWPIDEVDGAAVAVLEMTSITHSPISSSTTTTTTTATSKDNEGTSLPTLPAAINIVVREEAALSQTSGENYYDLSSPILPVEMDVPAVSSTSAEALSQSSEFMEKWRSIREYIVPIFNDMTHTHKLVIKSNANAQNTFLKASNDTYYAILKEEPFFTSKRGTKDYIGVDLGTGVLVKLRSTRMIGKYENECNRIMGELAHTSFRSHYFWGKHWLATKWITGRSFTNELNDPHSRYEKQDLLDKAAAKVDFLKSNGFSHGSSPATTGSNITDHMIVDKEGQLHLLDYRYCHRV